VTREGFKQVSSVALRSVDVMPCHVMISLGTVQSVPASSVLSNYRVDTEGRAGHGTRLGLGQAIF